MSRIDTIGYWHDHYNTEDFNGKLCTPGFGLTRSRYTDGYYEHKVKKGWVLDGPPEKSRIVIAVRCFDDEDLLRGVILHEMVHQYQAEILGRKCNHDAVFCSICRKLERKYNVRVR
jgi:hypothetical protein